MLSLRHAPPLLLLVVKLAVVLVARMIPHALASGEVEVVHLPVICLAGLRAAVGAIKAIRGVQEWWSYTCV